MSEVVAVFQVSTGVLFALISQPAVQGLSKLSP